MAAGIFIGAQPQFFDSSGNPVALGSLTFYSTGTTTKKKTYKEVALTNENDNPMTLDAAGRPQFPIYGTGAYKVIVKNSAGVQVGDTQDPVYFVGNPSGIGNGTITSAMIQNGTIVAADIAAATITGAKIAVGTVTSANIQNATIQGADIAAATIVGSNIANLTIDTANIAAAAITTAKIGALQVTTAKINDLAITSDKLGTASVITAKIGALQVTAAEIANATITGAKIGNLEVKTANIDNLAVTSGKIGTSEVKAGNIEAGAVTSGKIGNLQVTAGKIGNLEITAAQIANLTITGGPGGKIATNTITDDNIVANTISAISIAAGAIATDELAADSVIASKILADTIRASHIDVGLFLTFPSDENLTLYLKLDEVSGTVATDSSGNDNTGALINSEGDEWTPDGVCGGAYAPDAADEEINVSNDATLNPGAGDFSYTFWMIGPNFGSGAHYPIRKHSGSKGYIPDIQANGTIKVHINDSVDNVFCQSTTDVDDGNKHFIIATIDHTTNQLQSLYVDGELEDSEDITSVGDIDVANAFLIADNCNGLVIDEVRFYKGQVLTPAEVRALYLYPSGNESGIISGNTIAANTITASEINGAGFGTLTISSGKIVINTADALEIGGSGNINLLAGGDITLSESDTNPSIIRWSTHHYLASGTTAERGLGLYPGAAGTYYYRIGYNPVTQAPVPYYDFDVYVTNDITFDINKASGQPRFTTTATYTGGANDKISYFSVLANGPLINLRSYEVGVAETSIRVEDNIINLKATLGAHIQAVNEDASSGKPVFYIYQSDVDEPFVKFSGWAAAADLTRSIVDEGDQAGQTLEGWLKVEVLDYGNQIADQDYFVPIYTLNA